MPYQFDYRRYTNRLNTETGQIEPTETLSPRSDAYANNGFIISFYHMITGKELKFKAFITSFNETYTPDYASEQVFGRADPIHTYRGTTRSIALGFVIPAESISEAYENLAKTQTLAQMQYPAYTDVQNALTIAQAPLVRLKVMNLLRAANKGPNQQLTGGNDVIIALGMSNGLELNAGTMDSGAAFGDRNGYTLTFDGIEALPFAMVADYTTDPFDNAGFTFGAIVTS